MELVRTINSNKRYYLDEHNVENADALISTMRVFNDAKIQLYNAFYDLKYFGKGPLVKLKSSAFLKEEYGMPAYYSRAINTAAAGQLSSQCELQKLRTKTLQGDIENRKKKIAELEDTLARMRAIKESIRTYAKTGKWEKPYPSNRMRVQGDRIFFPNGFFLSLDTYEYTIEGDIRSLKTRLALVKEACKVKAQKLKNTEDLPPKRIVFGSRKLYSEKDTKDVAENSDNKEKWKRDFKEKRYSSMTLPGRHDSKYCNFLCKYENNELRVTCIDGTVTVFKDFALPYYMDEFTKKFDLPSDEREAVCYNFTLHRDKKDRLYIIVSVAMKMQTHENTFYDNGAIGLDINWDHFALSEVNEKGELLDSKIIRFELLKKSTGQNTNILGRAVKEVFDWCAGKDKRLIVEDIDMTIKLASRKYGSRTSNHHMTLFAYHRILLSIENQALKRQIAFRKINPAYTSQIGKFLFMRKYGISVHTAASYAIALVGLGLFDMLAPDERMMALVKDAKGNDVPFNAETYIPIWKKISAAFSKVKKHYFYQEVPYDVLTIKKRPSLKSLAAEMNVRYAA